MKRRLYGCDDGPATELSTPDAYLLDDAGYDITSSVMLLYQHHDIT
jgi:hypothetical protein